MRRMPKFAPFLKHDLLRSAPFDPPGRFPLPQEAKRTLGPLA
jgi:hypothetical protein